MIQMLTLQFLNSGKRKGNIMTFQILKSL